MTTLYHGADEPRARRILAAGFTEQDETKLDSRDHCGVLLSTSPECWDDMPRLVLLAVELPLTSSNFSSTGTPTMLLCSEGLSFGFPRHAPALQLSVG